MGHWIQIIRLFFCIIIKIRLPDFLYIVLKIKKINPEKHLVFTGAFQDSFYFNEKE